jgi:hypothetical protein
MTRLSDSTLSRPLPAASASFLPGVGSRSELGTTSITTSILRRVRRRVATRILGCVVALGASAGGLLVAPNATAEPSKEDPFSHEEQVGLRVGLTLPYKVNFRFDDSPPCDTRNPVDEKKVCPIGAPLALDLALSYALSGTIEPFFWVRLGLAAETQTSTAAATIIGAGLRLYTQSGSRFKIYLQPAIAAELEGPTVAIPGRNWETDFVMQVHLGGQYDFNRHVGAYVSVGPSVAVVRALSLGIEGSLGVQARFP